MSPFYSKYVNPREMVDLLTRNGCLTDPRVAAAMLRVPRERFVPGLPPEEVYADKALVTKYDENGLPISSSSQPAIVATMLEQLRVEPGQRVLEIGAGTGYNAALLRELAGQVVSVEIDEDIARQAAERLDEVDVRLGDGWLGAPDAAPYDRIELTIGVSDLSRAWLDQLAEGGVLVVPLWLRVGLQLSVAFRREGEVLRSESVSPCGFQRLRGPHGGREGYVAIGDGRYLVLDDRTDAAPLGALLRSTPAEEPCRAVGPARWMRLAIEQPRTVMVGAERRSAVGLYDPGSLALAEGERLRTYGSATARDRLLGALATAEPLDPARLELTAYFGTPPQPTGWRFVRPSCTLDVRLGDGSGTDQGKT